MSSRSLPAIALLGALSLGACASGPQANSAANSGANSVTGSATGSTASPALASAGTPTPAHPAIIPVEATQPVPATPGDPWERTNRQVLDLNLSVDDAILKPIALGYREIVPAFARTGIRNVLDNIQEPRILVNNILQARFLDAGHTTMRFLFNSTVGVGGLFDVATDFGIARRTGDFGQTLYSWGLEDGPFVMLPLAGPSNVRDTFGLIGDGFSNPISYAIPFAGNVARSVVGGVDLREQNIENLDTLRSGSLDFYARLRSVWQQRRDAELGRTGDVGDRLDVLEDPGATR